MDTTSFPLQLLEHMHGTVAVVGSMNAETLSFTITYSLPLIFIVGSFLMLSPPSS